MSELERWVTDNEPSEKYPIYTRANAGEVYPDPVSPLSGSMAIINAGEAGWRDTYVRYGTADRDEFEVDRPNTIGCFGGYFFLNMSLTRIYGVRFPGLTPEMVDLQYFGEMPGIPSYESEARPTDESPKHTALLQEWLETWIFARDDLPELRDDARQMERLIASRPPFDQLGDQELVDHARSFTPLYRRLFCRHISTSAASGVGTGTVAGVCGELGEPGLTMTLVAGLGDVDSAAPSMALWALGRQVAGSAALTAAFDAGLDGLLDRVRAERGDDVAAFLAGVDDFIARFGARGPNEWELRSHTWGTRPALFLAAVDRMRHASERQSPVEQLASRRIEADEAAAKVMSMLEQTPDEVKMQFQAGLRAARLFLAGRERSKTNNIKLVHEMRLPLREVGRRWVEAGHLDNIEQVFMFLDEELDDVVEDPAAWGDLARTRERQYLELFELEPPFVLDTRNGIPPLSSWARRDAADQTRSEVGTTLAGIPGCPGTATGRARVVLDPSDPTALEPGDILVAPVTDPAWTPLFVSAGAVVVDVGAQITHAVIVSRELGIPCVVSVTGATHKIPDGALITVDGTAGTVTIDELP
ncbi:MAG TPA: PEP-utilizing enzyme [Acidimicrobiales bacterium]|nr:PEP-utilizing enzyme [Acidimicrobiales bacterium]